MDAFKGVSLAMVPIGILSRAFCVAVKKWRHSWVGHKGENPMSSIICSVSSQTSGFHRDIHTYASPDFLPSLCPSPRWWWWWWCATMRSFFFLTTWKLNGRNVFRFVQPSMIMLWRQSARYYWVFQWFLEFSKFSCSKSWYSEEFATWDGRKITVSPVKILSFPTWLFSCWLQRMTIIIIIIIECLK